MEIKCEETVLCLLQEREGKSTTRKLLSRAATVARAESPESRSGICTTAQILSTESTSIHWRPTKRLQCCGIWKSWKWAEQNKSLNLGNQTPVSFFLAKKRKMEIIPIGFSKDSKRQKFTPFGTNSLLCLGIFTTQWPGNAPGLSRGPRIPEPKSTWFCSFLGGRFSNPQNSVCKEFNIPANVMKAERYHQGRKSH